MSLVPTASAGSVTTLRDEVYAYMALTSRDISRLRTDISEESAKRAFFEAYIRTQLDRHRPVAVTPPAIGGSGTSVTTLNVAEVASSATPFAWNLAEVAPVTQPVTDDKDRRISELERKVALLTEAVTMFLVMKSEAEHIGLEKGVYFQSMPGYRGERGRVLQMTSLSLPHWGAIPCGLPTERSLSTKSDLDAIVEELQTNTVKTDTLLAALAE
jgi:hypothetical protein